MAVPPSQDNLIPHLHHLLQNLTLSPNPILPTPEGTKRRGAVALVLRIQPSHAHWPPPAPSPSTPPPRSLDAFFAQEWTQHGNPEVLFIKRAARKGDRWTSHIALPGGMRDAGDADDRAASIRETSEEVGLDLASLAIACGDLPQRVVTTNFGKKPLLVLCPYVFLLVANEVPALRLQPTEVAATHWVPLRGLLSPACRAVVHEDISRQLVRQETGVARWMAGLVLGRMVFAAIQLVPTESLHSVETPGSAHAVVDNRMLPAASFRERAGEVWRRVRESDVFGEFPAPRREGALLLWGLTLGVVSDFLDLLPPHDALTLWTYPTFTPLDVRFAIWLVTYRFKNRKRVELQAGTDFVEARPSFGVASESVVHLDDGKGGQAEATGTVLEHRTDETGFHGLGSGAGVGVIRRSKRAAVQTMLEGLVDPLARVLLPEVTNRARYYDLVRKAVALALVGRVGVVAFVGWRVWKRLRRE